MTPATINYNDNKEEEVTPTTQYCGKKYNQKYARNAILAEQQEYIEQLTRNNIPNQNTPHTTYQYKVSKNTKKRCNLANK